MIDIIQNVIYGFQVAMQPVHLIHLQNQIDMKKLHAPDQNLQL